MAEVKEEFWRYLLTNYRQLCKVNVMMDYCQAHFETKSFSWTDLTAQKAIYDKVLEDSHTKKYPPTPRYCCRFVNQYVKAIDAQRKEIYEPLLELYLELIHKPPVSSGDMREVSYRTYEVSCLSKTHLLTIRMAEQLDNVGLTTWEAGYLLAEFVTANPELFYDKVCLELGSGVGLTGIVLSYCNPHSIIFSDYTETVLSNIRENININNVRETLDGEQLVCPHIKVVKLDWEHFSPSSYNIDPDVILAADVVYDNELIKALISVLKSFLCQNSKQPKAYIATTKRNDKTFNFFLQLLQDNGIEHTDITNSAKLSNLFCYPREHITLSHLTAKN